MKYLSVCSGIEAATVAWHPLGWEPVAFSEIEPFPSAVLAHHYPNVPNVGDMTKHKEWNLDPVDLLVGGTPCQSFSVAGLRKGLDDPRGNLMLTYLAIADQRRPTWLVWENVPGVLSSNGGKDFGTFLGGLAELRYGFAYRVLDAQYFGVAQRRRRVFVVGYLGDWRPAAAVLFERDSLCGNPAPSREAGKGFARTAGTLTANGGDLNRPEGNGNELDSCIPTVASGKTTIGTLMANAGTKLWLGNQEALSGDYHILEPVSIQGNLIGRDAGGPQGVGASDEGVMYTLTKADVHGVAQPMVLEDQGGSVMNWRQDGTVGTLRRETHGHEPSIVAGMAVRRLMPVECERLQGFPDDYTNIPWRKSHAPDGPRYKALGNSMAVPVMAWIGKRIQEYMNEHHHPSH